MRKVPYGYCQCGCGQKTPIAGQTRSIQGWKKGEPTRFIRNHQSRGNRDYRDFAISQKPDHVFRDVEGEPCVEIPLTKDKWALVSLASYSKVKDYAWLYSQGFACRETRNERGAKIKERMHRTITGAPKRLNVKHRNGDRLDNRDCNLKIGASPRIR